jgi:beta-lactamase regulating signal transducer with metallopeptidase domain/HEAT repeat protein
MASLASVLLSAGTAAAAWLLTYAVHAAVLTLVAAVVARWRGPADGWTEVLWRVALFGGLVTATAQALAGGPLTRIPALTVAALPGGVSAAAGSEPRVEPAAAESVSGGQAAVAGLPTGGAVRAVTRWSARDRSATVAQAPDADAAGYHGSSGEDGAFGESASGVEAPVTGAAPGPVPVDGGRAVRQADPGRTARRSEPAGAAQQADPRREAAIAESGTGATSQWAWLWAGGVLLWLAAGGVRVAVLLHSRYRLAAALAGRLEVDGAAAEWLAKLASTAGLGGPVRLTASPACPVPMALSGGEICVPARFFERLGGEEQRAALAHELAHLVRRDPAWLLAGCLVERLFVFQPLHRLALRGYRNAAEYACDAWAVRRLGSALPLARGLASIAAWLPASRSRGFAGVAAMAHSGSPLVRRVERILDGTPVRPVRRRAAVVMVTVVLLGVAGIGPAVGAGHGEVGATGAPRDGASAAPRDDVAVAGEDALAVPREVAPGASPAAHAVTSGQDPVYRPPRPDDPLAARWAWARAEGDRRGGRYWVGYLFEGPDRPGWPMMSDGAARGVSYGFSRYDGPPLARLLLGREASRSDREVAVFFLFDGSGGVERMAIRSIGIGMAFDRFPLYALGSAAAAESIPFLERQLDAFASEPNLQEEVVDAIGVHGATALVVPVIARVLTGDRPDGVRAEAAEALELHPTDEAFRLLVDAAHEDPSSPVQAEAAEALGELQHPGAPAALLDLSLNAVDRRVGGEATEGLGQQPPAEAIPALERIAREAIDPVIRAEAVETLGDLGPPALDAILDIIAVSDDERVRREALETLADISSDLEAGGLERVVRTIERAAFEDGSRSVQMEAVDAARELPGDAARALLRRIADDHPSRSVREEARDQLRER